MISSEGMTEIPMRETRHILNHPRTGNTIELTLDEETGGYKLRLTPPRCADEDFLRDLRRWIRSVGRGWQKRNGHNGNPNFQLKNKR
jgi:hypothetical protein